MPLVILLLAFTTFISTLIGGLVAIRLRNMLPYFFAFASGTLLSVSFLDILPESMNLAQSINLPVRNILIVVVVSFSFYSFLERYFLTHHYHSEGKENGHGHIMGPIGAGSLVIHSLLDGVAIGAAYAVSPAIGLIVALAVIFHDFTDGINTVTIMLKNKQHIDRTAAFLFMDAVAPVLGVLLTYVFVVKQLYLSIILAIFTGEFLYIGATSLLPETYKHTHWKMMLSMILGVALILVLTSFVSA